MAKPRSNAAILAAFAKRATANDVPDQATRVQERKEESQGRRELQRAHPAPPQEESQQTLLPAQYAGMTPVRMSTARLKHMTRKLREECGVEVEVRLALLQRTCDLFAKEVARMEQEGIVLAKGQRMAVSTSDFLRAMEILYEMAGMKVMQMALTNSDGDDLVEKWDEGAKRALIASGVLNDSARN